MRKISDPTVHEISPERASSKAWRIASLVVLGLLLAMPLEEGASLCIGQWRQVMGTNTEIRTPILDSVTEWVQSAHQSTWNWLSPQFQRLPWNPSYVLPIAAVVTVLGMFMLRR
jgi:hypothetical protein